MHSLAYAVAPAATGWGAIGGDPAAALALFIIGALAIAAGLGSGAQRD